jgi:molybdenum cofactor cytidylyltransferase
MGSPKALLDCRGTTFIDRLVSTFSAHCTPIVAVLGSHADAIQDTLRASRPVQAVINPHPERGMISSLQTGLAAIPDSCKSVFFHPCDIPEIDSSTLDALLGALASAPSTTLAAIPAFDGRRGHPVLIRSEWIPAFLALPMDATAKSLLDSAHGSIVEVPVKDPAIRRDYDTPEDYARAFGARP